MCVCAYAFFKYKNTFFCIKLKIILVLKSKYVSFLETKMHINSIWLFFKETNVFLSSNRTLIKLCNQRFNIVCVSMLLKFFRLSKKSSKQIQVDLIQIEFGKKNLNDSWISLHINFETFFFFCISCLMQVKTWTAFWNYYFFLNDSIYIFVFNL